MARAASAPAVLKRPFTASPGALRNLLAASAPLLTFETTVDRAPFDAEDAPLTALSTAPLAAEAAFPTPAKEAAVETTSTPVRRRNSPQPIFPSATFPALTARLTAVEAADTAAPAYISPRSNGAVAPPVATVTTATTIVATAMIVLRFLRNGLTCSSSHLPTSEMTFWTFSQNVSLSGLLRLVSRRASAALLPASSRSLMTALSRSRAWAIRPSAAARFDWAAR